MSKAGSVNGQKPHFIGIGTRRCASSRIQQLLSAHPAVFKQDGGQHYFSENFEKGINWYESQFENAATESITVDISVSQMYPALSEQSAERIQHFSSQPRLFATLRNPVNRAYSDYARSIMLCEIDTKLSFIEACEKHPEFLERSKYHQLLTPYWQRFGVDAIKLFYFEEIFREKEKFFNDMASYFDIDPAPFFEPIRGETGHGHASKSPTLQRMILGGKTALRNTSRTLGLENGWNHVTRTLQPVYQKMLRMNARQLTITSEERAFAEGQLEADTVAFLKVAKGPTIPWEL